MATRTSIPLATQHDWFLAGDVHITSITRSNQADVGQKNGEWTKWWAEAEHTFSYPTAPRAGNTFQSTTIPYYAGPGILPAGSPASTNSSELFQAESQEQAAGQDETLSKARKRKIQNREAQRKCRDRRREQVLNLGERLRTSMAENKNLQTNYAKLQEECERLRSENGIYFELLQSFWTSTLSEGGVVGRTNEEKDNLQGWWR